MARLPLTPGLGPAIINLSPVLREERRVLVKQVVTDATRLAAWAPYERSLDWLRGGRIVTKRLQSVPSGRRKFHCEPSSSSQGKTHAACLYGEAR